MNDEFSAKFNQFANTIISFSEYQKTLLLETLPSPPEIIQFKFIMRLGPGKHHPCIHHIIPEFPDNVQFLKSFDGEKARYHFKSKIELKYLSEKIQKISDDYGYSITAVTDDYIEFKPSPRTSIAPILSRLGLVPLYTEHTKSNETIFFAVPYSVRSYDLLAELEKVRELWSKPGREVVFPKKIHKIGSDVHLPQIQFYNHKFIAFLISNRFTRKQVMTLVALYYMAEHEILIQHVKTKDLVELIHRWWNRKDLPIRTIEKHLDGNNMLQYKLSKIYDYSDMYGSIKSDSNHTPEIVSRLEDKSSNVFYQVVKEDENHDVQL